MTLDSNPQTVQPGDVRVACSTSNGKVVIMNAFGPKKGAITATFEQPIGFVYKVAPLPLETLVDVEFRG